MVRENSGSNRRAILRKAGAMATVGTVGLAGCSGLPGGDSSNGGDDGVQLADEIEWTIYTSPGGGFDAYSRAISPVLAEQLSEHGVQDVLPENRTGAGGVIALDRIYSSSTDPVDNIGIWQLPAHVITQLSQDPEFELREMTHFGQVAATPECLAVPNDSDIETYSDLIDKTQEEELDTGATGVGGGTWLNLNVLKETDGLDANIVSGYEGAADIMVAMQQGELDFVVSVVGTVKNQILDEGHGRAIVQFGDEPDPRIPDVPLRDDSFDPPLASALTTRRVVSGPPDIDEETTQVLREGLMNALETDEVQNWSEEAARPIVPAEGDDVESMVPNAFDVMSEYNDLIEQASD